ncbi:hypothetical protein PV379_22250, partial [Streptomyces caniscabiei]|nr:hypothetical protein [Streptomyces caniscabiei]
MSDDPASSSDATPPWLRPEIPEHLRPFAAPPRPAQAPTVPGPRDPDGAAPSAPPDQRSRCRPGRTPDHLQPLTQTANTK